MRRRGSEQAACAAAATGGPVPQRRRTGANPVHARPPTGDQIDLLVTKYGVEELVFMDDIFNFKAERAKTTARGIIERGYKLALTFPNGFRGDILGR